MVRRSYGIGGAGPDFDQGNDNLTEYVLRLR